MTPGMFSGRSEEILALEQSLFQTRAGNPNHFLIQGERGIGKSSLLFYLQCVARGDISSLDEVSFRFVTVSIVLEPANTYMDIIKKVGAELQRVVAGQPNLRGLVRSAWDFLKRWEVMGVRYTADERAVQPHELLDDLTYTIDRTAADTSSQFDGILILIDEADKPPATANVGELTKVLTERLTGRGCNRVCLGLAGQPSLLTNMRQSHESSPRIFNILTLEPLLPTERIDVVRKGLAEAQRKNDFEVTITPEAEEWISAFSEGYPHFIQQFSYCAFDEDSDNMIDRKDVVNGAFREHGAFQQLGLKYFHEQYFEQISSDQYRGVLRAMSEHGDGWVSKDQIRQATKIKESILNNAVTALKKRHIIVARDGVKGEYRLPTKAFAVWIKGYTQAPKEAGAAAVAKSPPGTPREP